MFAVSSFPLALLFFSCEALTRTVVSTPDAPAAIGPYSQAIMLTLSSGEKLLHVSGQIGLDPSTGALVGGGIVNQTSRALLNIGAILDAAGAGPADVTECTCLLTDLAYYSAFNTAYASFFATAPPARAAVQVASLPRGALCEIKCSAAFS
jgi:2-iminobutanoate/2-iminopropanoate deaminase